MKDGRAKLIAYGSASRTDPRPVDGATVFESQSVTKVFTALLLADMVRRGEVSLDDPVSKYLPTNTVVPKFGQREITLLDLATHTSGLPREGGLRLNASGTGPDDYTLDDLYGFLRTYQLHGAPGSEWAYSNVGFGLLGHALERRAATPYAELVRRRILAPLSMTDSVIGLPAEMLARMPVGHDGCGREVPTNRWTGEEGAWALRTTANDLLKLVSAELGFTPSALAPAMRDQLGPMRESGLPGFKQGLGWEARPRPDGSTLFTKEGLGPGFHSYVAFNPKWKMGVVVLGNSKGPIVDIARFVLEGAPIANADAPTPPSLDAAEVQLSNDQLSRFVGDYVQGPARANVVLENGVLIGQIAGQPKMTLSPRGAREFFIPAIQGEALFDQGPDGRITGLVVRQACRQARWTRSTMP